MRELVAVVTASQVARPLVHGRSSEHSFCQDWWGTLCVRCSRHMCRDEGSYLAAAWSGRSIGRLEVMEARLLSYDSVVGLTWMQGREVPAWAEEIEWWSRPAIYCWLLNGTMLSNALHARIIVLRVWFQASSWELLSRLLECWRCE